MLKRLGRIKFFQEAVAFFLVSYIRFVRLTNRFTIEPPDADAIIARSEPVIVAMWHGQHFMVTFAWRGRVARIAALISRHDSAGISAAAHRRLGVITIRGSGGRADRMRGKGGVPAMREMLRELAAGTTVAVTADLPKRARVAGAGIVTLARLSGRPIMPLAVVTSRRHVFNSWDRGAIGKPFGRGAIIYGEPIYVAADADEEAMERARKAVEAALDDIHARAYGKVGGVDPGAGLRGA